MVTSIVLLLAAAPAGPPPAAPPPGPGWVRVGDSYEKTVPVKVMRPLNGGGNTYWITAENGESATLHFADGGDRTSVYAKDVAFDVTRQGGKPHDMWASLLDNTYLDLNGDGVVDAWIIRVKGGRELTIVVGDRLVRVEDGKAPFRQRAAGDGDMWIWGAGRKTAYVFAAGKWEARDGDTFNTNR